MHEPRRRRLATASTVALAALIAASGCGDGRSGAPLDGSSGAQDAATSDAGLDGATDSGTSGTDAGLDASTDAGLDASTDGAVDATTDASTDAGIDASTDAGATVHASFAASARDTWEGTGSFPLVVTLDAPAPTDVTIAYRASGGSAQGGGVDYTLANGTLSIAAGTTSGSFSLLVVNDALVEQDETVSVVLESPTGAVLSGATTCTLTIEDDEKHPWPGADAVVTADGNAVFGGNLSGLVWQPANGAASASLLAVQNNPSKLYRLAWNGSMFTPVTTSGWGSGKTLQYPAGTGGPDAESVTMADLSMPYVYVASERDNTNSGTSRNSLLLFDVSGTSTTIAATREWNLTSDLPTVGANLGIEAVTFVPDAFLVAHGFYDEHLGATYDPAAYPNHQGGLFFVGVEANGMIYVYALDHVAGTAVRIASFSSGQPAIMGLELDREVGYLWAACDNGCNGQLGILRIEENPLSPQRGRFQVRRAFDRPTTMPNLNNEGIAIGAEAECIAGRKPFYWTDDGETGGHAIRRDSIPCGDFL